MAVFGTNEYGSPLGAIDPKKVFNAQGVGYYDYSGFSSRNGLLGFSGFSMAAVTPACAGIELIPWKPTLVFPLNYEVVTGPTDVIWREAIPRDSCGDSVTYEIQYTATFSRGIGWRTIATNIPMGTTSYNVDFGSIPYTDDGGIRVRARDQKGIYSEWSSNIRSFSIANHPPNPVRLLFPPDGQGFDESVVVIWKEPDVADIDGHPVTYMIQVTSSYSSDSGWITVPGGEAVPRGITSFVVNSFEFPEGVDYGIRVVPIDELGARGIPAKARLVVKHAGNFIIDTLPPEGSFLVNDGASLTTDKRVKLDLSAFDITTGVKDIRISNSGENFWSDWDTYVPQKFWDLTEGDGLKRILVQFRDYAGNISEVCDCEVISRLFCSTGNATDLESMGDKLYAAFDKDGNIIEYSLIPSGLQRVPDDEVTALAKWNDDLYAASYNGTAVSAIYRMRGVPELYGTVQGKILSMVSYNTLLFVGLEEGKIVEVSGSGIVYPPAAYLDPVTKLRTDGARLYALAGNKYVTYDGVSWQENGI